MKVELEKLRLGVKAITETVCIGVPDKDNISFKQDKDVTNDFIKCIIDWCGGYRRTIKGEKEYQVGVIETKGFKKAFYSRNEVVKLLSDAVKEGMGEQISAEKFIKKHLK